MDILDLPPYELTIESNTLIKLLRNIEVSEGICNGKYLFETDICNKIIKAKIATGENFGLMVHTTQNNTRLNQWEGELHYGALLVCPLWQAFAITYTRLRDKDSTS